MNKSERDPSQKGRGLDIIEKVLKELRFHGTNRFFLNILEHILHFNNDIPDNKRLLQHDVTVLFLEHLQSSSTEDCNILLQALEKIFIPKELRNISVQSAPVEGYYMLGKGGFGIIYLGKLRNSDGTTQLVAVKTAIEEKHNDMLLDEAKIMARLDHKNVVKILAFQKKPQKLIMELLEWKNLEEAVQSYHFTDTDILRALHDVASGMEYISQMKFVHRDLACKNVFVDFNKVCKVGDFGLSLYVGHSSDGQITEKDRQLFMFNTAPEAKLTQTYSTKSDVWSFGVLVWELYNAKEAVDEDLFFPKDVLRHLVTFSLTGRLPRLQSCSIQLFDYVTENILNGDPQKRPCFTAIKEKIGDMLIL